MTGVSTTRDSAAPASACGKMMVEGVRLGVRESGEGRPLLLIHGYGVSHLEYRHVIEPLSRRMRVVAPDLPGHGESDAPDGYPYTYAGLAQTIVGLLGVLRMEHVSVIGHSMGGGVALHLAAHHGHLVERLVLADAACYPTPLPWEGKLLMLPGVGPLLFRYLYGPKDLLRYFRKRVYHDATALDEAVIGYYWNRMSPRRPAAYQLLRTVAAAPGLSELPQSVRCPTLVIWGEEDRIFPASHGRRLAAEIRGAAMEVFPDCGHAPAEEQPDRFVETVERFLS